MTRTNDWRQSEAKASGEREHDEPAARQPGHLPLPEQTGEDGRQQQRLGDERERKGLAMAPAIARSTRMP